MHILGRLYQTSSVIRVDIMISWQVMHSVDCRESYRIPLIVFNNSLQLVIMRQFPIARWLLFFYYVNVYLVRLKSSFDNVTDYKITCSVQQNINHNIKLYYNTIMVWCCC